MFVEVAYNLCVSASEALHIGEFSRRVGVSSELLRAWERRYGLLSPIRSRGGFRLYTSEDAERVARMLRGMERGLSAAQAASAALQQPEFAPRPLQQLQARLLEAIGTYDEPGVHAVLDEALAAFGLPTVLQGLIFPALTEIGQRWERDELQISQEHFASNLIRARLLALARLWGRGAGPLALLACAPGEHHDISLLGFGLLLRSHGWRIVFLGADTPLQTLDQASRATEPDLVVIASFDAARLQTQEAQLRELAARLPLALSGPGASEELAHRLQVRHLAGDPLQAVQAVIGAATRPPAGD